MDLISWVYISVSGVEVGLGVLIGAVCIERIALVSPHVLSPYVYLIHD